MSKITLTGTIARVNDAKTIASGTVREVIINRKYHDPESGELKNEDWFPVQVFKDQEKIAGELLTPGRKVKMEGYVNGRRSEKDGTASYFCNIVAKSFTGM